MASIADMVAKARRVGRGARQAVKIIAHSVSVDKGTIKADGVTAKQMSVGTAKVIAEGASIQGKDIDILVRHVVKGRKAVKVVNIQDIPLYDDQKLRQQVAEVKGAITGLKFPVNKTVKLEKVYRLLESIRKEIKRQKFDLESIRIRGSSDPESYVPVRLTDGKEFYEAIQSVVQGGVLNFIDTDGKIGRALTDTDGHLQVDVLSGGGGEFGNYEYMGKQESGDYVYYGFKKYGGGNWKIMRKDTTDDGAWQYAYGTSGWSTAWSDPTDPTYGDPPDN